MEAYMEKNSEDPIKNENKDCPFVFSNFKKWLNNQSEEKENKKPYVGLNVEPKISESKLLNKIEPVIGDLADLSEEFSNYGGTISEIDGHQFLIETDHGSFFINRIYVKKSI
jgi:hypothetical protein